MCIIKYRPYILSMIVGLGEHDSSGQYLVHSTYVTFSVDVLFLQDLRFLKSVHI